MTRTTLIILEMDQIHVEGEMNFSHAHDIFAKFLQNFKTITPITFI